MSSSGPDLTALTVSDAWIALALCSGTPGAWVRLRDLVGWADDWDHSILTFDEVSFGLPRLAAAGLAQLRDGVDGPEVRATPECRLLHASALPTPIGGMIFGMAESVGVPLGPDRPAEDRRLGRLPGLDVAMFEREVRAYQMNWPWE